MAYMSQERKAKIAPVVKAALKKYDMKGSLSVSGGTLTLKVKSGALDMIGNMNETCGADYYQVARGFTPARGCVDVNPYHYQDHFSGQALSFLKEVFAAMNEGNHDNSDISTDYFDVGWYVQVAIGSWNKPYEVDA